MAVTSIWRVNGWLGKVVVYVENPDKTTNPEFYGKPSEQGSADLEDVIAYAINGRKTELVCEEADTLERFVSGVNCHPATARTEMMAVKKHFGNQSMMLLGIPGSGKSFFAKLLIISIALSSRDDIIILDPEGEYTPLVKALGGSVIRFAVGGTDWLNAMDMENGYGEGGPVAFKSQFIMSLLKQVDPDGIGPHQKSIIDRCVAEVCKEKNRGKGQRPSVPFGKSFWSSRSRRHGTLR